MKKRNHFYFFWRGLLLPFFQLKYRMKYIGAENVPAEGAYILASNHTHAVDPIIMGMGLKRQVMFMAKEELFKKNRGITKDVFLTLDRPYIIEFLRRDSKILGLSPSGAPAKTPFGSWG